MTANHGQSSCLRIVLQRFDPFVMVTKTTPPYEVEGIAVDILNIMLQHLGLCSILVGSPDNVYGFPLPNGSWTGSLGILHRKEADMSASVYIVTEERAKVFDISEGIFIDEQSIGYKRPKLQSDITGIIRPFTTEMWIAVFLCPLVILIATILIQKACDAFMFKLSDQGDQTGEKGRLNIADTSMFIYSSLLAQYAPWEPRMNSVRVIGSVWLLGAFILATVYRSNLMAMLIAPKVQIPFNSFEELAKTDCKIYLFPGTKMMEMINTAQPGSTLANVRKNLISGATIEEGSKGFYEEKWGVTTPRISLVHGLHLDFSRVGYCRFYIAKEGTLKGSIMGYVFPKNSSLKPKMDRIIRNLKEFGIINHLIHRRMRNASECLKPIGVDNADIKRPLSLVDFYSSFVIIIAGSVLGTLTLMFELLASRFAQKQ